MQVPLSLEQALTAFTQTFSGSARHFGTAQLRDPLEPPSSLLLGAALSAFYARVCLADRPQVGGVMQLRLFAPGDDLLGAQQGWRWIRNRAGAVIENPDWKSSWIVIADRNGDALFVDAESPAGAVFGSIQQRNFFIAADLGSFLLALSECMRLEQYTFQDEVLDDDFNVLPAFLAEAKSIAERILGAEGRKGFMKFFFE